VDGGGQPPARPVRVGSFAGDTMRRTFPGPGVDSNKVSDPSSS